MKTGATMALWVIAVALCAIGYNQYHTMNDGIGITYRQCGRMASRHYDDVKRREKAFTRCVEHHVFGIQWREDQIKPRKDK